MEGIRKSQKVDITTDPDGPSEKPEAAGKLFQDFSSYTSLHGFQFLFRSHSTIRRLIWIALLVSCTAILAYQFRDSWNNYHSNFSFFSKHTEKSDSLVFPAVSICNQNMMKKSKIEGKDAQAYLDRMDPIKYRAGKMGNVSSAFDVEKAVLESGHNASDMIKICMWNGRQDCGPQNFTMFYSLMRGLCYTFNSGKKGHPLLNVTSSGKAQGLTLYLDAQPEEYYGPFSYESTGFKVFAHDQKEEIPNMEDEAQVISPGFHTMMRIRKTKITTLKLPFSTGCDEKKLTHFQTYTQHVCLWECYTNLTISACGCRVFSMPGGGEFNQSGYCNMTKITDCFWPVSVKFNPSHCHCPDPCERVKYTAELSLAYSPSNSLVTSLQQMYTATSSNKSTTDEKPRITLEDIRKRLVQITIFYKTTITEVITERAAYDLHDFGSDVGGNMGLFLGCSLLTICEFIDLIFVGILTWWRRRIANRHV